MDAKELLERIEKYSDELPRVRYVPNAYALVLAGISHKLTPEELDDVVSLGALVKNRATVLVPVLRWEEIDSHLAKGRAVF